MTHLLTQALISLSSACNLSSGISHSNDKNRAKETFKRLYGHGEILLKSDIAAWAKQNGWKSEDADELANLGRDIGQGKKVVIKGGPWWSEDIIEKWLASNDEG